MNEKNVEIPDRCVNCPYYNIDRSLEYYNYPVCTKKGWNIKFSTLEGWDRMVWCPLLDDLSEDGT